MGRPGGFEVAPALCDLSLPTVPVWGAEETEIGPELRDRFAALRPAVPLVVVPRASLNLETERPRSTIETVDRFLDAFDGAAGS